MANMAAATKKTLERTFPLRTPARKPATGAVAAVADAAATLCITVSNSAALKAPHAMRALPITLSISSIFLAVFSTSSALVRSLRSPSSKRLRTSVLYATLRGWRRKFLTSTGRRPTSLSPWFKKDLKRLPSLRSTSSVRYGAASRVISYCESRRLPIPSSDMKERYTKVNAAGNLNGLSSLTEKKSAASRWRRVRLIFFCSSGDISFSQSPSRLSASRGFASVLSNSLTKYLTTLMMSYISALGSMIPVSTIAWTTARASTLYTPKTKSTRPLRTFSGITSIIPKS
mmetsp:Transcript_8831/g.21743  ORF Transcript_8831/g.21743 Transcript_8831/m.21743 type:complete len:287 (+) Transcript_8831:378-1238(+)